MGFQFNTRGDVLRHTMRRTGTAIVLSVLMTGGTLLPALGTDFRARVEVGYVLAFVLCMAVAISGVLAAALSLRSALLMRQLSRMRSEMSRISQTDQLTGLPNRRGFDDAAAAALEAARQADLPAALFMCDVDRFKSINDQFGHEAGDKVLAAIAEVLRQFARNKGALVARYGGEEFAALMIGVDQVQAERCAEEIRQACAEAEIAIGETLTRVTISIGYTVSNGGFDLVRMMRIADSGLYAAKARGRDRVEEAQVAA
jgi:diguanylate cyclase (GGDEF)-like protein